MLKGIIDTFQDFHVDIYFQEEWYDYRLRHNNTKRVLIKDAQLFDMVRALHNNGWVICQKNFVEHTPSPRVFLHHTTLSTIFITLYPDLSDVAS